MDLEIIQHIPIIQKSMERENNQDLQQNESVPPYSFLNGYFGKPTKMRTSEPTMFEILTWNDD